MVRLIFPAAEKRKSDASGKVRHFRCVCASVHVLLCKASNPESSSYSWRVAESYMLAAACSVHTHSILHTSACTCKQALCTSYGTCNFHRCQPPFKNKTCIKMLKIVIMKKRWHKVLSCLAMPSTIRGKTSYFHLSASFISPKETSPICTDGSLRSKNVARFPWQKF